MVGLLRDIAKGTRELEALQFCINPAGQQDNSCLLLAMADEISTKFGERRSTFDAPLEN
jgi:hypothetical protein